MAHDPDTNPGERDPYEPLFGPAAEARNTPEELMRKRRAALAAIDARTVGIKPDLTDEVTAMMTQAVWTPLKESSKNQMALKHAT